MFDLITTQIKDIRARPAEIQILWGLYLGLVGLQMVILYRITSQFDELMIGGFFWVVFTQKLTATVAPENTSDSNTIARLVAYALIACIIFRSVSFYWFDPSYSSAMPFLIVLAMGLMTVGWRLQKMVKELLFCATLLVPLGIMTTWFEGGAGLPLQLITTKVSSFVLYYIGLPIQTEGTLIHLPQGTVNVELACTSYSASFSLLQILFLLMLMFPLRGAALARVVTLTFLVTQIVSVLRVSLLAYVVDQPKIFSFWHDDQGQQVVSTFLILFLGLLYYISYVHQSEEQDDEYTSDEYVEA
ncbi:MAG: archaeosortase/exosortase family protein [Cyanobacteria bacterium P01_F01_bin.42]